MALMLRALDGSHRMSLFGTRFVVAGLVLAMSLILSACDEEERRAISPGSVREAPTEPADEPEQDPVVESQPRVAPLENGVLGMTLPRADRVYFANRGEIWQVSLEHEPIPVITEMSVTGFSTTATGHRLAVLSEGPLSDDGHVSTVLSLVLPDGTALIELSEDDDRALSLSPVESIALTPTGNRMAMSHHNGAITMVSIDGEVAQLLEPDPDQNPGRLEWSSDGQFIAYLDPWLPNEPSSLYVMLPESGIRQVLVRSSEDGHGVTRAQWIPGTSSIVFAKTSSSTIAFGGDLFLIDALSGEQQLLVPSGQFAPVAGAVDIAVSPGGDKVALTAFVPGGERPRFAGVWIVGLVSREMTQVPVEVGDSVTDLWWLGDNLLLRAIDNPRSKLPGLYTGLEEFTLLEYDLETGEFVEHVVES